MKRDKDDIENYEPGNTDSSGSGEEDGSSSGEDEEANIEFPRENA